MSPTIRKMIVSQIIIWVASICQVNAQTSNRFTIEEIEPGISKVTYPNKDIEQILDTANRSIQWEKLDKNIQIIDLTAADTSLFNMRYKRGRMFPFGGSSGRPMVFSDFNNNGRIDAAGIYKIEQNLELYEVTIAELLPDSSFEIKIILSDSTVLALEATDLDKDGLNELNVSRANGFMRNYEQSSVDSMPNIEQFDYQVWYGGNAIASETFVYLDQDSLLDVIHTGNDSLQQCCEQIYIAEYDSLTKTFQKRSGFIPQPEWRVDGFSVGDWDGDGLMEFATGSLDGDLYVFENTGNDSYVASFQDTLSTPNAFIHASAKDIDGNGKPEFFVGGTAYYNGQSATRIYWLEASGDNQYEKVRSFFLVGTSLFGFAELFISDINNDDVEDLLFSFSKSIVILTWNANTAQFDLLYYDLWEASGQEIQSINFFDTYNRGMKDLFVSVEDLSTEPQIKCYLYEPDFSTGVATPVVSSRLKTARLYPNYPNPFNGKTTIRFDIEKRSKVNLRIYDVSGKEIIQLISDGVFAPGSHSVQWTGKNYLGQEVSTGIYFYVLLTENPTSIQGSKHMEVAKLNFLK